jgi:O-antigen/teichoic acid export membrane protein
MSNAATETAAADLEQMLANPGLAPLGPIVVAAPEPPPAGLPQHVKRHMIASTSMLGVGVMIERGLGFAANILAARLAGSSNFGAYALAISTANNISTYAAGGIGATAARFSGKYPYGSRAYATLARALIVVSLASAMLAVVALWFGAGPIAHFLGKQQLTSLLRWASLSAAGIILLECARGFFVGQRRLLALLLLSLIVGGGMILLLPMAARTHQPALMVSLQGAMAILAVVVCLLFAKPLQLLAAKPEAGMAESAGQLLAFGPMVREVWAFGGVQLAGVVGSNLAGWWLTTLVARADTSLVQMSFFAIASQWRNLVGLAPALITEGSYAVMASGEEEGSSTPHRVMALCSFASTAATLVLAACGMVIVPWVLTSLYGQSYSAAGITVAVGLAVAVVHMSNAPAAARLTIVSIRATGVINTVWAFFVAVAATLVLFRHGSAWQAMCIYFAAHVLSAALVLLTLARKDHVPRGLTALFGVSTVGSTLLAVLAVLRGLHLGTTVSLTLSMALVLALLVAALYGLARNFRWLPSLSALRQLAASLGARLGRRPRHV